VVRKGGARRVITYLIDSVEVSAQIAQVDVGLDDVLQSHVGSLQNSFKVLDNLSSPILDLVISFFPQASTRL